MTEMESIAVVVLGLALHAHHSSMLLETPFGSQKVIEYSAVPATGLTHLSVLSKKESLDSLIRLSMIENKNGLDCFSGRLINSKRIRQEGRRREMYQEMLLTEPVVWIPQT
jgi:hypothetical protein